MMMIENMKRLNASQTIEDGQQKKKWTENYSKM